LSPVTPSKLRKFYKPPMLIIFGIPQKILLQEIRRKKMTSNKEMSTVKGKKIHYQENPTKKKLGEGKKTPNIHLKQYLKQFLSLKKKSYFLSSS
jgi:hypothetical protein